MAQTYTQSQQQGQNAQAAEYTLPGVLHFLQSEWRRYERDRNEWEIERAEMKARIALLEGERRGMENTKMDLMRRVRMLEYALRQERSKYLTESSQSSHSQSVSDSLSAVTTPAFENGPSSVSTGNLLQSHNVVLIKDAKTRAKSRELLKTCLQEIEYLTNVATNVVSPNGGQAGYTFGTDESGKACKIGNGYAGVDSESNDDTIQQRRSTINIMRPSRPEPAALLSSIISSNSSSPPLDQPISPQDDVVNLASDHEDDGYFRGTENLAKNTRFADDEQTGPTSLQCEGNSIFITPSGGTSSTRNGVEDNLTRANGDYYKNETTLIYKSKAANDWREHPSQGKSPGRLLRGKSAEELKEEEEQLTKDVQKKFNLSNKKMTKLMKNAERRRSQEMPGGNSLDPQLDELSSASLHLEDDESGTRSETDKGHENGLNQRMWKQRFTIRGHLDSVRSISWHHSELMFISGSEDGTLKLWDVKGPVSQKPTSIQDIEPVLTYRGHSAAVNCTVMSTDQRLCYSGSMDSTIRVWKMPSAQQEPYAHVDLSLNTATYIGHADAIWDLRLFPLKNQSTLLLASASADGTVKIWDTKNEGSPLKCSWNYFGNESGKLINGGGRPPVPTSVDFLHSDLRKIAISYQNSIIKIFDIETGQCVVTCNSNETYDDTPATQINHIITHPTMSQIFSAHEDSYIRSFDANSGQCIFSMSAHLDSVTSLDVDPTGMVLISGGHDASMRLWDILSMRTCIQEFVSHRKKSDEGVLCVQYHPTLPWLASGGGDSVVKIYC